MSLPSPAGPASYAGSRGQLSRGKKALLLSVIYLVFAGVLEIGARIYAPQPTLPYVPSTDQPWDLYRAAHL